MQTYARIIGVLLLLTILAGGFGEVYVPAQLIVSGNAVATTNNVRAHDVLFRAGFAAYLVEAVCDIALALYFYLLLRPVRKDLALLSAFFGLVSTAIYAMAEFCYFAVSLVLNDPALVRLLLRAFGLGAGAFMALYGIATLLRGYLIYKSTYLPKFLGVLMVIAGAGFIAKNFLLVLAPAYASDILLLPMFVAALALTIWLLTKGVASTAQVLL